MSIPFYPADILLPKRDFEKFAVIACDQFTSDEKYWSDCDKIVGELPSALRLILPEVYLHGDIKDRIADINKNMKKYLSEGVFEEYRDALIFVRRTLPDGKERLGIVGKIDLEEYSYKKGEPCRIRPTEATVLERIPPRVEIRKDAPIELPHVMLLIDNEKKNIIEPLKDEKLPLLYDFTLMQGGGSIKGYLVPKDIQKKILCAMEENLNADFPIAVGDGNHSLATAKACYELNKTPLSRYALCEIVNIHDSSLEFEPIYRTVFGADADELYSYLKDRLNGSENRIEMLSDGKKYELFTDGFTVEKLQNALDAFISSHKDVKIDYIHGEKSARDLAQGGAISFIFDGMKKSELFPIVKQSGVLPRKTFSMGEAESKRYYIEARRIK